MRTRGQVSSEIYEIIFGNDIRVFYKTMDKNFPKSRRSLDKPMLNQLEELIPLLKSAYFEHAMKQSQQIELAAKS